MIGLLAKGGWGGGDSDLVLAAQEALSGAAAEL